MCELQEKKNPTNPSCGQCTKAKKECPGYRDLLELSFRNESDSVIKKVNARYRRTPARCKIHRTAEGKPQPQIDTDTVVDSSPNLASNGQRPTLPSVFTWDTSRFTYADYSQKKKGSSPSAASLSTFSIYPTIEDRGIAYFAANFVTPPDGPTHGSLSPKDVLKNSALLAVLMLAIFETTAGSKQLSLKEWRHHMNGAATLLKLRGRSQLIKQGIHLASFIRDNSAPGNRAAGAGLGMGVDEHGKRIGALRVMMHREDAEPEEEERMLMEQLTE
ncbi:hypothetical protein BKA61DRAFT_566790 [Leptodontidium sp. MPI-SDFR-AT-0119]|nr:hypothetical protein BKA61DRAFT_566790 [Leptodontidium sp. MPI-SDFR-AT-0119]